MFQFASFGSDGDGTDIDGVAAYRAAYRPTLRAEYGDDPAGVPFFTHSRTGCKRHPRRREAMAMLPPGPSPFEVLEQTAFTNGERRPHHRHVVWINREQGSDTIVEIVTSSCRVRVKITGRQRDAEHRLEELCEAMDDAELHVFVDRRRYVPRHQRPGPRPDHQAGMRI